jgi:NAD(P)-dependent dehydrogenase (short-subunit alcohol dehydrogenase family)
VTAHRAAGVGQAPGERIAVVTGAGTGVGRAAALALLADGWCVALAGRRSAPLAEVAESSGVAERTLSVPTDVADPVQADALFAAVVGRWGRVDLLFNNAGISLPATPIDAVAVDDWRRMVDVNLNGMFFCLQAAFRTMRAQQPQGGRIINNGSISAHAPRPESAAYTATKHAITGLTKAAALDGRPHRIAVGQIDIGNAATDMTARMVDGVLQANGTRAPEPRMDVRIAGESVRYMANLPLEANVLFHTVMATTMPFVGRG